MKIFKLLLGLIMLSILLLTGCQKNNPENYSNLVYNSSINDTFVDGVNNIYGSFLTDSNIPTTIIQDKNSRRFNWFTRDPFYKDTKTSSSVEQIHIDYQNKKGYYMDSCGDNIDNNFNTGFSIIQFDLGTFDKKEIYKENFVWHKSVFLGLGDISDIDVSKENDFSESITANVHNKKPKYFIDNNNLYLIRKNGIFVINIENRKETAIINEDNIVNVSYDTHNIYYINSMYELYKYTIKTGKRIKLTGNKSSYLITTEDKIIYTNLNDKNCIYTMNKDGLDNHKIGEYKAKNLNYDSDYIYYSNEDDGQCLYRMRYDGSENTKMTDVPAYFVFAFNNYNKVYIWSNDDKTNGIKNFSVDKKDFTIELLDLSHIE